jgi:hypothetical protein
MVLTVGSEEMRVRFERAGVAEAGQIKSLPCYW